MAQKVTLMSARILRELLYLFLGSMGYVFPKISRLKLVFLQRKKHNFDLGSVNPKIIIECKSHRWTAGGKVPSAKMTTWNEAMLYFHLAPKGFRKMFFTLYDVRKSTGETLVSYYKRTYSHLIPKGVQFLEFDESTGDIIRE